jgi:hypothetical protein
MTNQTSQFLTTCEVYFLKFDKIALPAMNVITLIAAVTPQQAA